MKLQISIQSGGFTNIQDCPFSVASEVFGKNSCTDGFDSEQACPGYVAEQLLARYPGIEIEGKRFLDTE